MNSIRIALLRLVSYETLQPSEVMMVVAVVNWY